MPGFFGFANFGEFRYFAHVRTLLDELAEGRSCGPLRIHYVPIRPTARLERRAAGLLDFIDETAGESGPIHLIGHSTGGVDARLVTTPGIRLPTQTQASPLMERVASVVSIASPHRGAPIARHLQGAGGQDLLRYLSAATLHVVRLGARPLGPMMRLADALTNGRLSDIPDNLLDQVFRDVLLRFDADQHERLAAFLGEVKNDQGLLAQLTPAGMETAASRLARRSTVRYGSVVVRARPPHPVSADYRSLNPTYAFYRLLHRLARPGPEDLSKLSHPTVGTLNAAFGDPVASTDNDAIVPTWSQLHGDLLYAGWADHLDVIGHFGDTAHIPPHIEWLKTDSGFSRPDFEQLWGAVFDYLLGPTAVRDAGE